MIYSYSKFGIYVLCVFLFLFTTEWLEKNTGILFPSGIRHIFLALSAIFFWIKWNKKSKIIDTKYLSCVIIVGAVGLIGSLFQKTPIFNVLIGLTFTLLPFFIFSISININTNREIIQKTFDYLTIIILLTGVYPVINHLPNLPEAMRWEFGLYREVGAYATVMNIGVAFSLANYFIRNKKVYLWIAIILSIFIFMTILKKTIISNFFVWIIFYVLNNQRIKGVIGPVMILATVAIIFKNALLENFGENTLYLSNVGAFEHVRLGMYLASFQILYDHFPIGTGFGSFGSLASIFNFYSPVYYKYGINQIGSNSEEDVLNSHHTLLDTFWPHIFAELGFIGSIAYLYLSIYPIIKAYKFIKLLKGMDAKSTTLLSFVIAINSTILWEGFSLYTPEIPGFIFITSFISAIIINICYKENWRFQVRSATSRR